MTIEEILALAPTDAVKELKKRNDSVPSWDDLKKQYDVKLHPVMDKALNPDKTIKGKTTKVSRITLNFQKLAAKRMTGLTFGIPVKRVYSYPNDSENEKKAGRLLEKILTKNRINSCNIDRFKRTFSECEILTLWYAVEETNFKYGEESKLKLKCKTYSPEQGHTLYPLYDEFDDMVAISIAYSRKEGSKEYDYLDTYTATTHIRYKKTDSWAEELKETISIEKIPAIYTSRTEPIWEDNSENIYEMEWALSRNGNYIRKNSKPIMGVFADEEINMGEEKDDDDKSVFQYPQGSDVKYITWAQATESLKFQIETLKTSFFTQLQLPDMSHENMKSIPMSGEARKMMFIDAEMKVNDESGPIIEFLDREVNVIKAFMKKMWPAIEKDIESLEVENIITPYRIADDKENVEVLMTATGGKAIMSQKEGIKRSGFSNDTEATYKAIQEESKLNTFELTE